MKRLIEKYNDYPFEEVAAAAQAKVKQGCTIHQKWSCDYCNSRQTMEEANKFFTSGKCEECGKITDIKARGCNYTLIIIPVQHGR
jgi:hypothetical protein